MTPLEQLGAIFTRILKDEWIYKHINAHSYTSRGELCIDGWADLSAEEMALINEAMK